MSFSKMSLLLLLPLLSLGGAAVAKEDKPNIIFILTEDMGWGDLPVYGHPYARMPNCDRLAREGMKLNRFYVTGTTCNPSRTGLMTGRNPAEFPSYPADFGIPEGLPTVTNLLHDNGYRTGHVGKWHLGPEGFGDQYGMDTVKVIGPTHKDPRGRDSAVFGAALDFIEETRDDDRPFYLNIWSHVAHSPVKPPQHLVDLFSDVKVDRSDFDTHMHLKFDEAEALGGDIDDGMRNYLADLYALDMQIGWILDKLDRLGLADNTVLAISADHGAAPVLEDSQSHPTNMMGWAGGLRGGKHDFFEGGLREPFLIRWPGHVPAGATSDSVVWAMDWLPTVASMAGISIDGSRFDGEDVTDILTGKSARSRTNPLVWKFPHKNIDSKMVMLYDDWKLHLWKATGSKKEHKMLLYDLREDPGEDYDLHDERADVARTLSAAMIEWESHLPTKYAMKNDRELPFDLAADPYVAKPPFVLHNSASELEEGPAVLATSKPTPMITGAPVSLAPTDAPVSPSPTKAPVSPVPTDAPVSPVPTEAPESPAPTDSPVSPSPTMAPVSPAPTTLAPSRAPTLPPTPNPTVTPKTCEANGSSCGGEPGSLPCCQGTCTHVHGLGKKCLWIQPPSSLLLAIPTAEPSLSTDWVLKLFDIDASVSASPTKAPVSPIPTEAPVSPSPTKAPVSPVPTDAPVSPSPTKAPVSPVPTDAPVSPSPTKAPVSPVPTEAPESPAPTDSPVSPSPTMAPVSPAPTTLAPSRTPTLPPTPNPTVTPKTCEANGSSCGGEPGSLPCCQGVCTHVHGLGKKCLWIQPSASTFPTEPTADPTPNSHENEISANWAMHLFGADAPVSQPPTTLVPSRAPISITQADSAVASSSRKTCETTGSSCGEVDSKPCCPGDRCVHVHGLGRKCLWIQSAAKSPPPSSAAPTSSPSSLPPTAGPTPNPSPAPSTAAPTPSPTEEIISSIWSTMQFGGARSFQDAHKEIEAFLKAHTNRGP